MKNISAIVITKNEEQKLEDCLKSLVWCDDIIIVDTGSIDDTIKIAKKYTKNIFNFKGQGSFQDWRNEGLKKSKTDWILYLDSDERVSETLKNEIIEVLESKSSELKYTWYAIPRKNIVLGKELKHGGLWPDYVKRLYNRENLENWVGDLHEEPVVKGEMGKLTDPIVHYKHDNIFDMVEKTNKWSGIEAKLLFESKHPDMNIPRFLSAMIREFYLRMIRQKAFLDGRVGIIYAMYQVWSRFLSYAKLWEMQNKKNI